MKTNKSQFNQSVETQSFPIGWLLALVVAIIISLSLGLFLSPRHQIAYVDSEKVFEEFAFSKELQAKLGLTQNARKQILDSLGLELKGMQHQLEQHPQNEALLSEYQQLAQKASLREEQLSESDLMQTEEYNKRIWRQLSQYLQEFSDEKGLDYLFHKDQYMLVGAKQSHDLTQEAIHYVNAKYYGK